MPESKPYAIILLPRATHPLLKPGAPVYSLTNDLFGWTVEAADGSTFVYAPTEGDGHEHAITPSDRWGLVVWWEEGQSNAGWDRLRRSVPITWDSNDPVEVASKIFEPGLLDLTRVCLAAQVRSIVCEIVVLERRGPSEDPGFTRHTLHPDPSSPMRVPDVTHLSRRLLWGWKSICDEPWTPPADHGLTQDPQRVTCPECLRLATPNSEDLR